MDLNKTALFDLIKDIHILNLKKKKKTALLDLIKGMHVAIAVYNVFFNLEIYLIKTFLLQFLDLKKCLVLILIVVRFSVQWCMFLCVEVKNTKRGRYYIVIAVT